MNVPSGRQAKISKTGFPLICIDKILHFLWITQIYPENPKNSALKYSLYLSILFDLIRGKSAGKIRPFQDSSKTFHDIMKSHDFSKPGKMAFANSVTCWIFHDHGNPESHTEKLAAACDIYVKQSQKVH